jgi:hypothetical protein
MYFVWKLYLVCSFVVDEVIFVLFEMTKDPEPEPTVKDKMYLWANDITQQIRWFGLMNWAMVSALIVILILLYRKFAKRVAMSIRGIHCEAMSPGSTFITAEIPSCQVAIKIAGVVMDKHNGYGWRYEDYLVAPAHVFNGNKDYILQGRTQVAYPAERLLQGATRSTRLQDVIYIPIAPEVWSRLGTARANVGTVDNAYVSIVGPEGASTGLMRKTTVVGQYSYTGSTKPGMSGAVYQLGNKVVAMHQGTDFKYNYAISATGCSYEIQELKTIKLEDSEDNAMAAFEVQGSGWAEEDIQKKIQGHRETAYSRDRLAALITDGLDNYIKSKRDAGDELWEDYMEESVCAAMNAVFKRNGRPRKYHYDAHGIMRVHKPESADSDEDQVEMQDLSLHRKIDQLLQLGQRQASINHELEARLAHLEKRFDENQGVKNQMEKLKCDVCKEDFRSRLDLDNHKKFTHNAKKEKFPCDQCNIVCLNETKLANHVKASHTSEKTNTHQCPLCKMVTTSVTEFVMHMRSCGITVESAEAAEEEKLKSKAVSFLSQSRSSLKGSPSISTLGDACKASSSEWNSPYQPTTELKKKTKHA